MVDRCPFCGSRNLMDEVEERYSPAFEEVGPGALTDLKRAVDAVKAFLELLSDPKVDFRVKLMDYVKLRADVAEFSRYYARWLGSPLAERLKAEIYEVLQEAISFWGRQGLYDVMEV